MSTSHSRSRSAPRREASITFQPRVVSSRARRIGSEMTEVFTAGPVSPGVRRALGRRYVSQERGFSVPAGDGQTDQCLVGLLQGAKAAVRASAAGSGFT